MQRRVAITGIGVISSIGLDTQEFWQNCLAGRSVVEPIPDSWSGYADYQSRIWSPPPPLNHGECGFSRIEIMQHDPAALQALCAARQALQQAGLSLQLVNEKAKSYAVDGVGSDRCGVFMGTGIGGVSTLISNQGNHILARRLAELAHLTDGFVAAEEVCQAISDVRGRMACPGRFNPFTVSMVMPNAVAAALSIKFGFHGPARSFCAACASGTVALGHAFEAVRRGEVDLALGGGSEFLADEYGGVFRGFDAVGALVGRGQHPDEANCPFDRRHSGFLFSGGGAGVLVLEERERALQRGAEVIAEIAAYAESSDGRSMMLMDESAAGIKRMLQTLMDKGGVAPEEISYINAHGTGTPANDTVEARAIDELFGSRPLVNSTKSLLGHSLGASGAIEAAVAALSIRDGKTHICRGLRDPIRDLNFVREVKQGVIDTAISQSFAFGGHNAALLFR